MLRKLLDKAHPLFAKGGKLEKLYPLYEAKDTFLYTPGEITDKVTHVRDGIDLKRMMSMVIIALLPCIFFAMYNTGFQANRVIDACVVQNADYQPDDWHYQIVDMVGVPTTNDGHGFLHPSTIIPCLLHGAIFFLPVYIVTMAAGGTFEVIFAIVRKHEINEGFLVTGMLFPLTLPATIPLWQVAIGIIFGVVIGKEIFGGTGKNFLNPALTARCFLYFAYAPNISGSQVWTAVNGFSGATALGALAEGTKTTELEELSGSVSVVTDAAAGESSVLVEKLATPITWWDAFIGNIHGSMGETSTLACLIGAFILIAVGIGSWRIMAGVVIGAVALSAAFMPFPESAKYALMGVGPHWHLVIGGLAFGAVFMATDPVSASMTDTGKWIYGILIGAITIMVRVINPAFPEGVMLAILFGNVFAPLIDYFVVQANIKRRLARNGS